MAQTCCAQENAGRRAMTLEENKQKKEEMDAAQGITSGGAGAGGDREDPATKASIYVQYMLFIHTEYCILYTIYHIYHILYTI